MACPSACCAALSLLTFPATTDDHARVPHSDPYFSAAAPTLPLPTTPRSTLPEGAYFVLVNTARLEIPADFEVPDLIKGRARDWVVAWFVAQTAKVVLIPPTDFYSKPHWDLGKDWIRVCVALALSSSLFARVW